METNDIDTMEEEFYAELLSKPEKKYTHEDIMMTFKIINKKLHQNLMRINRETEKKLKT